jgi:hypothetical protein
MHTGSERIRLLDGYDCRDAGGRQKTAPAFSAFATSLWFSNAGAIAESGSDSLEHELEPLE